MFIFLLQGQVKNHLFFIYDVSLLKAEITFSLVPDFLLGKAFLCIYLCIYPSVGIHSYACIYPCLCVFTPMFVFTLVMIYPYVFTRRSLFIPLSVYIYSICLYLTVRIYPHVWVYLPLSVCVYSPQYLCVFTQCLFTLYPLVLTPSSCLTDIDNPVQILCSFVGDGNVRKSFTFTFCRKRITFVIVSHLYWSCLSSR